MEQLINKTCHQKVVRNGKERVSDSTAAYLVWRTGLCCHHGWPGTSLPLSGTSETVNNMNRQSHTASDSNTNEVQTHSCS